jgi:NADP-dependent 3-hydroxy acid dehydrogenase YdfG
MWSDGSVDIGSGTVAVVTGAGSGIGAALAGAFRAAGARVVLADVDRDGLERTAAALPAAADAALARVTDVSDRSAVAELADAAVGRFGHVDVVVNNAGIALDGARIDQLAPEQIATVMDVNFWGVVHGTQVFLPHLTRRPRAAVVNVSSIFGITAMGWQSAYVASKFAVRGFTEALRMELAHVAPHVNAVVVHPGGIRTGIVRASRPTGVRPDHVARRELALFQAGLRLSPEAAARAILDGLRRDRSRVLIGGDAVAGDRLARLLPAGYTRLFLRRLTRAGFFADEPPIGG